MQAALYRQAQKKVSFFAIPLAKAVGWGVLSGLIATLVMDLILMSLLVAAGMAASSCFSIVGDMVAKLLSLAGVAVRGSIFLGIAAHYLIGPLMGGMYGAAAEKCIAAERANLPRLDSVKKAVIWAVLYAEILSQPLLAMAPILIPMTASDMMLWFGGSIGMHMIWGCVLGAIWSRWFHLPVSAFSK